MNTMFKYKSDAIKYLVNKGMFAANESPFSDLDRIYFAYGENDVFLDHSATVTKVGVSKYAVSDFSHLRKV